MKLRTSVALAGFALLAVAACGEKNKSVGAAAATASAAQAPAEDPSAAFLAMADRHAREFLKSAPEAATELGVSEEIAGENYVTRLGGYGFEAHQAARQLNEMFLQELKSHDRAALTGVAATTYDVLRNAYEVAAQRNQFDFGGASQFGAGLPNSGDAWAMTPYFMTQLTGPHLALPRMLMTQHPIRSKADGEAYVARLKDLARALDSAASTVAADAGVGVAPPRFAIEAIVAGIEGFISPEVAQNPLVNTLSERLGAAGVSADDRAILVSDAVDAMRGEVYPAYARLAAQFDALKEQSSDDAGVWRLGDEGEAWYQLALAAYGAGMKSADDVHEIGLAEVERISAEMDRLLKSIGLGEGAVGERMVALSRRPDNLYPNTDEGRAELLAALRGQVADILAIAPQWFGRLPQYPVEVRRIPEHEQDSSPGGYYTGPSLDGSRPGIYWINLKDTGDNPKHSLKSLTYHEAVPGHHFQTAYQRSIQGMPLLRTMLGYSEYSEGWGLYAEALAAEMGMYKDDPAGDLGRLQAEIFRAARLVVDTGLHHKKWTRDQAIDYMAKATGETPESVSREIERYAVVPGQACAYKLGMLKMQELRAYAEAELGEKFDIRSFHDAVLSIGDSPLPVLEASIMAWVKAEKA